MKKIVLSLAAAMLMGGAAIQASSTPDIKDLLQQAANAAKERQQGASGQSTTNQDTSSSPTSTSESSQSQQGNKSSLGSLLGGLFGGSSSESSTGSEGSSSGLSGLGGLGDVVKGLISSSNVTPKDLVGNWKYSGPAFAFQSSNFLQKAGGAAASKVINDKLEPYYKQAGIDRLEATFNSDGTFQFKLPRVTLKGTYQLESEGTNGEFLFNFMALGKIPTGKMKAHVEKAGRNVTITFDVSKLIKIVDAVAKVSGQKSLQAASSLLNQYDGLNCGFELAPAK